MDQPQCSKDSLEERLKPIVELKSLLNDAVFPLYRTPILNPIKENGGEVEVFRPDPDVRVPKSFRGFIERVMTFKPQTWGADPNAALYFAKYGWRGATNFTIRCNTCLTELDCSHVVKKFDVWFLLAKRGHAELCPFQFLSTPDDLFKLPTDPHVIQDKIKPIWNDLVTLELKLPNISDEVISELGIENKVVELFFEVLDMPVTDYGVSALVLGLCGWVKGKSKDALECNFCQRCAGLWNFFSIEDKIPPPLPELPIVDSSEKNIVSSKPTSPSVGSEGSHDHEIIPSDCDVPLDSNDGVSEECSEVSEPESGYMANAADDSGEEADNAVAESPGDYDYEDDTEDSDEDIGSSNGSLQGRMFDGYVDSAQIIQRQIKIQLANKIKKRALGRYLRGTFQYTKLGYPNQTSRRDVGDEANVSGNKFESPVTCEDIEDEAEDEVQDHLELDEQTDLGDTEVCNGSADDVGLVSECNSLSDGECEVVDPLDPLDTRGAKRTRDNAEAEDLNNTTGVTKRRRLAHVDDDDSTSKEVTSFEQCTVVNVDDITHRLSAHGVTITKFVPSKTLPRDRGVKRKASLDDEDDEETEVDRSKCPKSEEIERFEDLSASNPPKHRKNNLKESGLTIDQLEDKAISVITKSKTLSDGVKTPEDCSSEMCEIPVDLRNGVDQSNNIEYECDKKVMTSKKESNAAKNNNKLNNISETAQNEIVTNDSEAVKENHVEVEESPIIPNGDPDVEFQEQPNASKVNGKIECNVINCKEDEKIENSIEDTTVKTDDVLAEMVSESPKSSVLAESKENHIESTGDKVSEITTLQESLDSKNDVQNEVASEKNEISSDGTETLPPHEICKSEEVMKEEESENCNSEGNENMVVCNKNDEIDLDKASESNVGTIATCNKNDEAALDKASDPSVESIATCNKNDENVIDKASDPSVESIATCNKNDENVIDKASDPSVETIAACNKNEENTLDKASELNVKTIAACNKNGENAIDMASDPSVENIATCNKNDENVIDKASDPSVDTTDTCGKNDEAVLNRVSEPSVETTGTCEKTDETSEPTVENKINQTNIDESKAVNELVNECGNVENTELNKVNETCTEEKEECSPSNNVENLGNTTEESPAVDTNTKGAHCSEIIANDDNNVTTEAISDLNNSTPLENKSELTSEVLTSSLSVEDSTPGEGPSLSHDEENLQQDESMDEPNVILNSDVIHGDGGKVMSSDNIDVNKLSDVDQPNGGGDQCSVKETENNEERMEVPESSETVLADDDNCENKEDKQEISHSEENIVLEENGNKDENTTRKRRRSSVEEDDENEELKKRKIDEPQPKIEEPVVKLDFHPVNEHRYWCIYRLKTTSSRGDAKPGWEQLKDSLRLSLSLKTSSYSEDVPASKSFRMRLADLLAHW